MRLKCCYHIERSGHDQGAAVESDLDLRGAGDGAG